MKFEVLLTFKTISQRSEAVLALLRERRFVERMATYTEDGSVKFETAADVTPEAMSLFLLGFNLSQQTIATARDSEGKLYV